MVLELNEYVRTKDGYIGKVCNENLDSYLLDRIVNKEIDGCETIRDYCFWKDEIEKYNITKHSFNIIDLIEEGDYVNGKEVSQVLKDKKGNITDVCYYEEAEEQMYSLGDIKSIVTKEQFKAIEYVIKEG